MKTPINQEKPIENGGENQSSEKIEAQGQISNPSGSNLVENDNPENDNSQSGVQITSNVLFNSKEAIKEKDSNKSNSITRKQSAPAPGQEKKISVGGLLGIRRRSAAESELSDKEKEEKEKEKKEKSERRKSLLRDVFRKHSKN